MAEQSPTSEMKAMYAKTIYEYMTVQARTFVMERPQFKEDAIKKAYELKLECADFIDLENSLNCFLIVIGEPLEEL
jgi:hypothetical protein